ncbi:MAG: response regulator, partial [Alistipes onderdonkii]
MECDNSVNPVGNRPRLLVAEDNPSNYKLVEVLLRRDYDLLHAWNGKEAVALFSDSRPDLVLMDINMPVLDGYEALRGVREIAPDVPVIALTAYAFETDRQLMLQAGFNECLAKPLRADELRTRITALLS